MGIVRFLKSKHWVAGAIILAILASGAVLGVISYRKHFGFAPEGRFTASILLGSEFRQYIHPDPAFSLEYPGELEAWAYDEGEGAQTITFQSADKDQRKGFQIFISPFDTSTIPDERLTAERIAKDLPGLFIEEPVQVVLGARTSVPEEARQWALIFWSRAEGIGRTREVWFARDNNLFAVTAYEGMDKLLAGVMSTFKFE